MEVYVTVPPNCRATVYFPSENGSTIREKSGKAMQTGTEEGYTLFEIPAGKYQFTNESITR